MAKRAKKHTPRKRISKSSNRHAGGTAHQRGYGRQWRKLRKQKLDINPLCERCESKGETKLARDVDHIRPTRGPEDPKHWDWKNLQSLCPTCHRKKTRAEMH